MQELAFNDACCASPFACPDQACEAVRAISSGLANLVAAGIAKKVLRLTSPVTEISLADGLSLYDAMLRLAKNNSTRDEGVFLQSLSQKIPLEDDLDADEYDRLATWELSDFPGCLGLLLCAAANRLAVSVTEESAWHSDFIDVSLRTSAEAPAKVLQVGNIYSDDTENLKQHCLCLGIAEKTPSELWGDKSELFPNLCFAPSVERNLSLLGAQQYRLAVLKLQQLNRSAATWNGRPKYLMNVRSESDSTMNKYGGKRKFQDADGVEQTYILHFTVADGYRAHIREIPDKKVIEIGYIGTHLKVAKKN